MARVIFVVAAVLGLLAMVPMYAAGGSYRYYGSLGGLVAWQVAFLLIAFDPARFRMMMVPAMMEKFLWVGTLIAIYNRGEITAAEALGGTIPHAVLGVLFVVAFFMVLPHNLPRR